MEKKEEKILDFALHATRNRRNRLVMHAIRAIASAALAVALTAAFHSALTGAQTPESKAGESEAEAAEKTADDSTEAAPIATEPSKKKSSKPFEPTERIEAESVISFPTNI
jgi:hypothetical protein